MAFVLRLGSDGQFTIDGEPGVYSTNWYHRSGAYRLENGWLTSPAINEGRPARLVVVRGRIQLTIDEALTIPFVRA